MMRHARGGIDMRSRASRPGAALALAVGCVWMAMVGGSTGQERSRPLAHWPVGAHIAVWIDTSHAPADAASFVERALKVWTGAAGERLTLTRTPARNDAAIRVFFVRSDTNYGETAPHVDPRTGLIASADVAINSDVPSDGLDARIVVYMTALHELGHALGLPHSDTFSAIMYRFRRPDDGERYFGAYRRRLRSADDIGSPRATGLADEDIEMLRRLYDAAAAGAAAAGDAALRP
jgi:hypothetical protein